MADLDDRLREEFRRDDPGPALSAAAVLDHVYARRRAHRILSGAVLAAAVALGVPAVVSAMGGSDVVPAPPSATAGTLSNPPRRAPGLSGVPAFLRVTATPPNPSFTLPAGDPTYYVAAAGSPVAGLVWVRDPVEPFGLPGSLVELRPGLVKDGTKLLVTDDATADAAQLRAWSPSGDSDYVLVYGGAADDRRSVLEAIVAATFG